MHQGPGFDCPRPERLIGGLAQGGQPEAAVFANVYTLNLPGACGDHILAEKQRQKNQEKLREKKDMAKQRQQKGKFEIKSTRD